MKDSDIEVGGVYWRLADSYGGSFGYPKDFKVQQVLEPDEFNAETRYRGKSSRYTAAELYATFEEALDAAEAFLAEKGPEYIQKATDYASERVAKQAEYYAELRKSGPGESNHQKPVYEEDGA